MFWLLANHHTNLKHVWKKLFVLIFSKSQTILGNFGMSRISSFSNAHKVTTVKKLKFYNVQDFLDSQESTITLIVKIGVQ